ncbi:DNA repair protein REV1 [Plodia interpunctella]|uniref:DNA repair protein REV1 n=1 Tax=Plodia interpunctella TaxID=58824 RepID=UPI0023675A4E|nr:DNA repair protein REV1 [Plodia interpunctella]
MRRRNEKFPDNGFEAWGGYMQAKIAKLEQQYTSRARTESNVTNIFSGVSIYVNGFTIPSSNELKALMAKHGGVYHTYQRNEDYIIASNLPDTKVKKMSLSRVVKPEWITDSIASNCLLDYRDYLLYRNSKTQLQLNFVKCKNEILKDNVSPSLNNNETSNITLKIDEETMKTKLKTEDLTEVSILRNKNISPLKESKSAKLQTTDFIGIKNENVIKTAADPNFISEFYNNSRLHHISQLGACFKQHVNDLRQQSKFVFPARSELKEKISITGETSNLSPLIFEKGKTIMHIDMDCFFVSVGLRNRPDLRGKPVAVTHSKGGQGRPKRPGVDRNAEFNLYRQKQAKRIGKAIGRPDEEIVFESRVDNIADEDDKYGSMSEIASCSYEARVKGISNGMFMGAALRLCPDLQTLPYDFDGYKEVAYTLYNTIAQYTLDIEAVSCDEMYVDCTDILKELGISAQDFATVLRAEIKQKTGCPCSTGFGGNRLQARLATKRAKPDGQFFLTAELVEDFMFDIKLKDLPGVGRQTMQKLESLGHQSCGSLQSLTLVTLQQHLGNKTGAQLFDQCRGRDDNPLTFVTVRKSVSAEVNYGIRFENNEQCVEFLKQLSAEVHSRMQQFKVLGKCITLKLMVRAENAPVETAKFMGHGFCDVINKSTSLSNATNDVEIITREVISLCKKQNIDPKEMRGIGIQINKLEMISSNKNSKGAISKFLSNTKVIKTQTKPEPKSELPVISEVNSRPQTPVKAPASPRHKSPILGSVKSPSGKRRGRPPKSFKTQQSASNNLMSKFLHGHNKTNDTPYKCPMIKEVDNVVPKQEMKQEHKQDGLLGLSWEKVRELLRAWLESGQTPLPCDVEMISAYMREMVINKNIDKLQILLNFLRRRTLEMACETWRNVNEQIIEQVQNAMIAVYGKKLYICN